MRKTCSQSKNNDLNWLNKVILPELNRFEYSFVEHIIDLPNRIFKFKDNILFDGEKIASYSCSVNN